MKTSNFDCAYDALRDQRMIVVGGDRRDQQLNRLCTAFALREVIHCPCRKTDASPRSFESSLHAPGIVLAVWALGLSRTHHGEHLHCRCRSMGIPWVDCYKIPHPNRLAQDICELRLIEPILARGIRAREVLGITMTRAV
jgi:hypothetical protein